MVTYTLRGGAAFFDRCAVSYVDTVLELEVPKSLTNLSYTIEDNPTVMQYDGGSVVINERDQIIRAEIDGIDVFGPSFAVYPTIAEATKDNQTSVLVLFFDAPDERGTQDPTGSIHIFEIGGTSFFDRASIEIIFAETASGWTSTGLASRNTVFGENYPFLLSAIPNVEISSTPADNSGDDTVLGVAGSEEIFGGAGDDDLSGLAGDDTLFGAIGNDTLAGGDGNDLIGGGAGNDSLNGDSGNDAIWTAAGDDTAQGGDGHDTLGGALGNDSLGGGDGSVALWGAGGDDTLQGGNGNDTLGGSAGNDSLEGGAGNDALWGAADNDTLRGGFGEDTLGGAAGDDSLDGGDQNDEI